MKDFRKNTKDELIVQLQKLQKENDKLKSALQKNKPDGKNTANDTNDTERSYKNVAALLSDYSYKINVAPDGKLSLDFVTDSYFTVTGRTKEEGGNIASWAKIFHPEDIGLVMEFLKQLITSHKQGHIECRSFTRDKKLRWINITAKPEYNAKLKRVTSIIGVVKDITDRKHSEEKVRESEEKFSTAFQFSPYSMALSEIESGTYLDVNKAFLSLTGFTKEEVIGSNSLQLKLWPDASIRQKFRTGIEPGMEMPAVLRMKSGESKEILYSSVFVQIAGTSYRLSMAHDITKQKTAEQALRDSEEKFRSLVWDMQVGVILQGPKAEIIMCNPLALELLGLSEEQLLGKTSFDPDWSVINEDGTPFPGAAHPVPMAIATRKPVRDVIMGVYRPVHNDRVWLYVNAVPHLNAKGEIIDVVCTFIDMTGRKTAEEALRESEYRLNRAEKVAKTGNWKLMLNKKQMLSSEGAREIYGVTNDAILLDLVQQIPLPEYREKLDKALTDLITKNVPYNIEFKICRQSDKKILDIHSLAEYDKKNNIVFGVIQDITERKLAEKALIESEQFLKETQAIAKLGTYTLDISTGIWTSSEILDQIFGIDSAYVHSIEGWISIVHPEWQKSMNDYFANEVVGRKMPFDKEYKIVRKSDGAERWIHGLGELKFNAGGQPVSMHGTIRDITERRNAEEALILSNQKLELAQRSAGAGTWDWDMITQKLDWSKELYLLLGLNPDTDATFDVWTNALYPDDRKDAASRIEKAIKERTPLSSEYRVVYPDGTVRWIIALGDTLYNAEGNPIRMSGICMDITDRKKSEDVIKQKTEEIKAQNEEYQQINEELIQTNEELNKAKERAEESEQALKRQNRLFELLLNNLQIGVFMVEAPGGKPLVANETAFKLLGRGILPDASRKNLAEVYKAFKVNSRIPYPPDEMPIVLGMQGIYGHIDDMLVERPDGTTTLLEVFGAPVTDDEGHIWASLVSFFDITERKYIEKQLQQKSEEIESQNEEYQQINEELQQTINELNIARKQAEESDRLKTAFLQNMSHEIRTPMNAIMGFADLLAENYNNRPKLEKYSEIINQRCNDLLDIINDILDISKIESGQLPVNIEDCNLRDMFAELTTFFSEQQERMGKQHIAFRLEAGCDNTQQIITIDKVKLKQIFINLISNAFKYTEAGTIKGGCRVDDENKLLFYLSDTGIGIPRDKHAYIFERFAQIKHGHNQAIGGTGLGLPIVKGLVTLLGGKLWLESEPGKGSTFYFTLPYNTLKAEPHKAKKTSISQGPAYSGKTILLVEDDQYNAEYLKEILAIAGLTIIHTEFGQEAVSIALSQDIDLVLMDIRLPDINGYEATRQICEKKPLLKIVAQTAYASHDEKQKALNAGCIDYMSKPTRREHLMGLLNKLLA